MGIDNAHQLVANVGRSLRLVRTVARRTFVILSDSASSVTPLLLYILRVSLYTYSATERLQIT